MKMRLDFDRYNGTAQFPITRQDVRYFQAMSDWAKENPYRFKLSFTDGSERNTFTFPINEAEKVNTLAAKLEAFDEFRETVFINFTEFKPPESIDELIRLVDSIDCIVWAPINTKAELGEFLLDCEMFSASVEIIDCLDAEKIAERWLEENAEYTCLSDNGYIEDNRTDEQKTAPIEYSTDDFEQFDEVFFIANVSLRDKTDITTEIRFPCSGDELTAALEELGAETAAECAIASLKCRYQERMGYRGGYEAYSLKQLNETAKALCPLSPEEYIKAKAIIDMHLEAADFIEDFSCEQEKDLILDIVKTLGKYDLYPLHMGRSDVLEHRFKLQNPETYERYKGLIDYEKAAESGLIYGSLCNTVSGFICTDYDTFRQTQKIFREHYTEQTVREPLTFTCTLPELIKRMEPQAKADKALITRTIQGLIGYASEIAAQKSDGWSEALAQSRDMVWQLIPFWGLNETESGEYLNVSDYMKPFDDAVREAVKNPQDINETGIAAKVDTLLGLTRYTEEMLLSDGLSYKDDIENLQSLMGKLAEHWSEIYSFYVSQNDEINELLAEYGLEEQNVSPKGEGPKDDGMGMSMN